MSFFFSTITTVSSLYVTLLENLISSCIFNSVLFSSYDKIIYTRYFKIQLWKDFPCGSVVKNLSSSARDVGLIPGEGTKISHAMGQWSPPNLELMSRMEDPAQPQNTEMEGKHAASCTVLRRARRTLGSFSPTYACAAFLFICLTGFKLSTTGGILFFLT